MRRLTRESLTFLAVLSLIALLAPLAIQAQQSAAVTVFEGARLIAGDGSAPVIRQSPPHTASAY